MNPEQVIPWIKSTFYFPELDELDIALYTFTVKEKWLNLKFLSLNTPVCHVIAQRFNFIGSQAPCNKANATKGNFSLIRSVLEWYQEGIMKSSSLSFKNNRWYYYYKYAQFAISKCTCFVVLNLWNPPYWKF